MAMSRCAEYKGFAVLSDNPFELSSEVLILPKPVRRDVQCERAQKGEKKLGYDAFSFAHLRSDEQPPQCSDLRR